MRRQAVGLGLLLFVGLCVCPARATTPEMAAELFKANTPDVVRAVFAHWKDENLLLDPLAELNFHNSHFRYCDLSFPGDSSKYLLLAWGGAGTEVFWRLLRSQDGGTTFQYYQDAPNLYSMVGQRNLWNLRLEDLTSDGIPHYFFIGPCRFCGSMERLASSRLRMLFLSVL